MDKQLFFKVVHSRSHTHTHTGKKKQPNDAGQVETGASCAFSSPLMRSVVERAFKSARLHETATQMALINPRGEEPPPPPPPPPRMNQLLVAAASLMCPVEDFGGLTPLKSHKS